MKREALNVRVECATTIREQTLNGNRERAGKLRPAIRVVVRRDYLKIFATIKICNGSIVVHNSEKKSKQVGAFVKVHA